MPGGSGTASFRSRSSAAEWAAACRLVPGHRAQEDIAFEREQPNLGRRDDGGGTGDITEQGDLAHVVARPERGDVAPVRGHVGLARRDHVDAVADIALVDDRGPGLDDGRNAVASEAFDRRCGKRFEQRGPSKQCEVVGGNPSADVHRPQPPTEAKHTAGTITPAIANVHRGPASVTSAARPPSPSLPM